LRWHGEDIAHFGADVFEEMTTSCEVAEKSKDHECARSHESHVIGVALGQPAGEQRTTQAADIDPAVKDLKTSSTCPGIRFKNGAQDGDGRSLECSRACRDGEKTRDETCMSKNELQRQVPKDQHAWSCEECSFGSQKIIRDPSAHESE